MHALCQTAALLAIPSLGRIGELVCPCIPHASPMHHHASNRRGVTHQAPNGVERPSLSHGEAFPVQVFSFDKRLFSAIRQFSLKD